MNELEIFASHSGHPVAAVALGVITFAAVLVVIAAVLRISLTVCTSDPQQQRWVTVATVAVVVATASTLGWSLVA